MNKSLFLLLTPAILLINACTSRIDSNQYSTSSTGEVNRVARCTVVSVRPVTVQSNNNAGSIFGGAAGAAAGTLLGSNDATQIVGGIGGAVVGGLLGDAAQSGLSKQNGYEYIVELTNGSLITVTQGTNNLISAGQKCMVLYGKKAKIIPAY